ncbi:uncharacterized protein LOC106515403 [Austrofundulus limnaeus]|uniref:Uncharacterized protein LOC106515403 n=1 Tax=Austrofundulus limnaeus TaxID=52670 RepID=A0A2I4AYV0_AUSLI|nr:PREDICTED: uncharacterized protein LOC106515403 [Austrofundulus limnaeus]
MLKPQQQQQQHGGDLLVHDPPPVFGKPWYWQRSSSTMESTRSLAQVIVEMRDEIKKLEAENRELRGECAQDSSGHGSGGACEEGYSGGKEQDGIVENPYGNLRRNASAPILEGQFKENSVMTVRRYSTSSNLSGIVVRDGRVDKAKQSNSAWGRLREEMQPDSDLFNNSDKREAEEEVTNRHSLQEYVQKNRAKVKSVSFLLPVDDIYTNRPVLTKHPEEPKITGLASISETDS